MGKGRRRSYTAIIPVLKWGPRPVVMSNRVETSLIVRQRSEGQKANSKTFSTAVGMTQLHPEALAEVELATDRVVDQKIFGAFALDAPFENQISAIDDRERLAH